MCTWLGMSGESGSLNIAGTVISGVTGIEVTNKSRVFELLWESYVAYSILNESFATVDSEECFEGTRFRVYSKSNFINYAARATFASPEYPGPTQHYEVVCQNHIVNVISVRGPLIVRLR